MGSTSRYRVVKASENQDIVDKHLKKLEKQNNLLKTIHIPIISSCTLSFINTLLQEIDVHITNIC